METDYLVVGAGPAGVSLACFLAQYGLRCIMISSAPGTADTPRAHLVNPMAIECLRELGLEDDCVRMGIKGPDMEAMRWCNSMVGEEYGRVRMWSGPPSTKSDMVSSTPCHYLDLPQSYLEPIMLRYATTNGVTARFNTELLQFEHVEGGVLSTVRDLSLQTTYTIRSRYIFGADGGRSIVARSGGFKFLVVPSAGVACNILFTADIGHLMQDRQSQLHTIMKPGAKNRFGTAPIMRMVRPWHEWMLVAFTPGTSDDPYRNLEPDSPELIQYLHEVIGDDSVDIKVHRLDPWVVRETVAERFSDVNSEAFILGDAAHRHPPSYGLGSNTCIQDGYNLAWKVFYVSKGWAGPGLLDTYTAERQPVGAKLVREANECMGRHLAVWAALGALASSPEEGAQQMAELKETSETGKKRRAQLHAALEGKRREGESLGFNYNQNYVSSAVYLEDEQPRPEFQGDDIVDILVSTYPGNRLPHAWLSHMVPSKPISTIDLAGHGAFSLFIGYGGEAWKEAAAAVSKATGIPIKSYAIGWGLDYTDIYREWTSKREVDEDGCVLVRPDRFVAWRSNQMVSDCRGRLLHVLNRVLSREASTVINGHASA